MQPFMLNCWAVPINTDAFNPVAPDPDGIGAAECMRLALHQANLKPEDIGYINAHGTATVKGVLPNVLQFALYSTLTMYPLVPQKVRQVI